MKCGRVQMQDSILSKKIVLIRKQVNCIVRAEVMVLDFGAIDSVLSVSRQDSFQIYITCKLLLSVILMIFLAMSQMLGESKTDRKFGSSAL